MPTIVMPVYDQVDVLDVSGPYEMFRWARFETTLVAATPGELSFNGGFKFCPDALIGEPIECDAMWVPGGNPEVLCSLINSSPDFLKALAAQADASKWVCSVCEGALLLAAAGLLDGYEATTHWAFIPWLEEHYPEVTVASGHPRFVLDRNRLTGGGISSGLDEALELIELLTDEATAQGVQQTTQYYPDPPVTSEIPTDFPSPMPC